MKLNRRKLRRIILHEVKSLLRESTGPDNNYIMDFLNGVSYKIDPELLSVAQKGLKHGDDIGSPYNASYHIGPFRGFGVDKKIKEYIFDLQQATIGHGGEDTPLEFYHYEDEGVVLDDHYIVVDGKGDSFQ